MRILIIGFIMAGILSSMFGGEKPKPYYKPLSPEATRMAQDIFLRFKLAESEREYGLNKKPSILTGFDVERIRDHEYMKDKR